MNNYSIKRKTYAIVTKETVAIDLEIQSTSFFGKKYYFIQRFIAYRLKDGRTTFPRLGSDGRLVSKVFGINFSIAVSFWIAQELNS